MRELQDIIESLATRVHRAVAIDDPKMRLLAHTAHHEVVDEHRIQSVMELAVGTELVDYVYGQGILTSTEPVRIPRHDGMSMLGRVCFPIRSHDVLLGFLWLIDDDCTLSEDDMAASVRTAEAAAETLFRDQLMDDLRRARERELLLDLISDDRLMGAEAQRMR